MITIVSGTNRKNSHTLMVAKYYQKEIAKKGFDSNLLSMEELPPEALFPSSYGVQNEAFAPFQELVNKTDKFIFIIPEYNGSFPGILKVFIDTCTFPTSFYDKKVALTGISSGKYGNIRGVEHFTGVCNYCHMHVLPLRLHIPAIHKELDTNKEFQQPDTIRFIQEQIDKFLAF